MNDKTHRAHRIDQADPPRRRRSRRRDDRGEGVISTAIAVLIMAGIGALMWVAFVSIWDETEANTRDRVSEIGG